MVSVQPSPLMPRPKARTRQKKTNILRTFLLPAGMVVGVMTLGFLSLPSILAKDLQVAKASAVPADTLGSRVFPVTVDPTTKTITQNAQVDKLLSTRPTSLAASSGLGNKVFEWIAVQISSLKAYQFVAGAAGFNSLFVTIHPGDRQEQVATAFGTTLGWTPAQELAYTAAVKKINPLLPEGTVVPGTYFLNVTSPQDVASLLNDRFQKDIVGRYSTTTQSRVPLKDALTIASLLDRESGSWDDMRLISGIIWNRLFIGMKLQIDATLQYAEANGTKGSGGWWPLVEPKDKYIKSAYNTYQHAGLPPTPIASPSLAAVLAALNPKKTDCIFYFHDSNSQFHCSKDYATHVALLKQYYGQGK
jgi:cell division protein YceG involved in septum cleavage